MEARSTDLAQRRDHVRLPASMCKHISNCLHSHGDKEKETFGFVAIGAESVEVMGVFCAMTIPVKQFPANRAPWELIDMTSFDAHSVKISVPSVETMLTQWGKYFSTDALRNRPYTEMLALAQARREQLITDRDAAIYHFPIGATLEDVDQWDIWNNRKRVLAVTDVPAQNIVRSADLLGALRPLRKIPIATRKQWNMQDIHVTCDGCTLSFMIRDQHTVDMTFTVPIARSNRESWHGVLVNMKGNQLLDLLIDLFGQRNVLALTVATTVNGISIMKLHSGKLAVYIAITMRGNQHAISAPATI